jgi:hypothetical protein
MGEITGGLGNALLMNIPDTTRISGTLTSQAFSLQQRALSTGGNVSYGGVISYCETLTADTGGSLTTSKPAAKSYAQGAADTSAWCYVRPHGSATLSGAAYSIPVGGNRVGGFLGTSGQQYDVFYFVDSSTCQVLPIGSNFDPSVVSITIKYAVYAKVNDKISNGTLQGYLYLVVPRAQFTGDAGIGANQTTNSTTSYDWTAVLPEQSMMSCTACGVDTSNYAYYIYSPCDTASGIVGIGVVGVSDEVTVLDGTVLQMPLVFLMENGDVVNADYSMVTVDFDPEEVTGMSPSFGGDGTFKGAILYVGQNGEPIVWNTTFSIAGTNVSKTIAVTIRYS